MREADRSLLSEAATAAPTDTRSEVFARLQAQTEDVLTSEGFVAYLKTLAHFHTYSPHNIMLIHSQRPDATRVAGYRTWQEFGRQVKRGEKGIAILVPFKKVVTDEDTGEAEHVVTNFGVGHVFDVGQTEGDELPEGPIPVRNLSVDERSQEVNLRLSRFLIAEGLRVASEALPGTIQGDFSGERRLIRIRTEEGVAPLSVHRTKTLAHEGAHYLANHRRGEDGFTDADREVVAEGSAFATLAHFALDSSDYSVAYIARWAKSPEIIKRNLGVIQQVSSRLITEIEEIENPFVEDRFERAGPRTAVET